MVRRPSCYSCIRVNTLTTTTETVIEKIIDIQREKRLQDTLKNLNTNDDDDDTAVEISENRNDTTSETSPVFKCQIPGLDYVVFVKGSGPHDIQYDYQEDRPPKEIIVSRKCAEAVLRGAQVSSNFTYSISFYFSFRSSSFY